MSYSTSVSSHTSSSSAQGEVPVDPTDYYTIQPPENSKTNWKKIVAIAVAVIGALIGGLGVLCWMGILPNTLLGGMVGNGVCFLLGLTLALPGLYFTYKNWSNP